MDKLIITCNPDNIASRRTCEKAGLKLKEIVDLPNYNEMYLEGERHKCIYEWILSGN
jgi:RimJ/RimL family protein N-acetyltransferase